MSTFQSKFFPLISQQRELNNQVKKLVAQYPEESQEYLDRLIPDWDKFEDTDYIKIFKRVQELLEARQKKHSQT